MAALNLKIIVLDTHDVNTICVADASAYPDEPPIVTSPVLLSTAPGFNPVSIPFNVQGNTIITSGMLGITPIGEMCALPDGLYHFNYSIAPSFSNFTEISIMRVARLQEKFDKAFMSLDFMVCDSAVKTQAKVTLNTIYLLIQGSIAAANECALVEANKLYDKASSMLDALLKKNCGCTETNFIVNFN
jgi:hypothetical protein